MPLYEYGCEACGHHLEVQQKMADAPLRTCPTCGKDELQRLISATSFVLKGSGWYKDGYSGKTGEKVRTDNDRTDRLQKAINDDKKKGSGGTGGSSDSGGSSGGAAGSSSGGTSGGSSGGTSGGTSGGSGTPSPSSSGSGSAQSSAAA